MPVLTPHSAHPATGQPLWTGFAPDFEAAMCVSLPSAHTVLFLAADAVAIDTQVIARFAEHLLASGLLYVCVWGPDCERVHDIFDEVHIGDGSVEPRITLISTWHAEESLEEALWFFLNSAMPVDVEIASVSFVAVTIGRQDWSAAVNSELPDGPAFEKRALDGNSARTPSDHG